MRGCSRAAGRTSLACCRRRSGRPPGSWRSSPAFAAYVTPGGGRAPADRELYRRRGGRPPGTGAGPGRPGSATAPGPQLTSTVSYPRRPPAERAVPLRQRCPFPRRTATGNTGWNALARGWRRAPGQPCLLDKEGGHRDDDDRDGVANDRPVQPCLRRDVAGDEGRQAER